MGVCDTSIDSYKDDRANALRRTQRLVLSQLTRELSYKIMWVYQQHFWARRRRAHICKAGRDVRSNLRCAF